MSLAPEGESPGFSHGEEVNCASERRDGSVGSLRHHSLPKSIRLLA